MKIRSAAFINALGNEIADRKRRIARLQKQRLDEVYSVVPAVRTLDKELKELAFDLGKSVMRSPDPDSSEVAAQAIAQKQKEREKLLVDNGFPPDYTDPKYICEVCRDTGRVGGDLCQCVTQLAVRIAFEDSGINAEQNFDNFDLSLQTTVKNLNAMTKIRNSAFAYAEAFPNNEKPDLLYYGPPGVGKTYLVNCIGGKVLERGYSVLKINAHRLIQMTMDNLRSAPEDRPDFVLPDLLMIDDLGTEPMIPNITIETLLSILSERQDSGKATVFATNLDIVSGSDEGSSIQDFYGERFASRLMAPRRVKIQRIGTDNVRLITKN